MMGVSEGATFLRGAFCWSVSGWRLGAGGAETWGDRSYGDGAAVAGRSERVERVVVSRAPAGTSDNGPPLAGFPAIGIVRRGER